MAWLRLDDKFAEHRKLLGFTRADRWTWLEVMLYCARHRSPHVPEGLGDAVKHANPAFLNRCYEVGLLDIDPVSEGGYSVHDWDSYNPKDPTAAERMRAYRERNASRNAERNDVRNETVTRAQPRARVPSPSPAPEEPPAGERLLSADRSETTANGALPISKELLTAEILSAIGSDADEKTPEVVRAFAQRLPPAALAKVNESLRTNRPDDRAAYAVGALRAELDERILGSDD